MSALNVRDDDFSVQITSNVSDRFFIRMSSPPSSTGKMIFSDFIINGNETDEAVEALFLISSMSYGPAASMQIVFENIYPSFDETRDKVELVRRYDQIVAAFRRFCEESEIKILDTKLNQSRGVFDIIVFT